MLRVITPDGQTREYPIDVPSAFIGRAEGNRVVIDHVSVSRRHARLVIDPAGVTIEDLGSANGTYVGAQRVQPNTPQVVYPGQELRFGDVAAWFVSAFEVAAAPGAPGGLAQASIEQRQTVAVAVISPSSPVAAGSPTTATVSIQNRGTVPDDFGISVPDLPPSWVRVSRASLTLLPGARDEVTVVITPPHSPEGLAGEHQLSVAVVSRVEGVEVRALGRFTVLPFESLACELRPARSRRAFMLVAVNGGNAPTACSLAGAGDGADLHFVFDPDVVELPPGAETSAAVQVRPASRRLAGRTVPRPFRVELRPAFAGQSGTATGGVLLDRSILGRWLWAIVAVAAAAAIGSGLFAYTRACGDGWPLCSSDDNAAAPGPDATATQPRATSTPPASATAAKSPTVAPTPAGMHKGGKAVVTNSAPNPPANDNCLAMRSKPAIASDNILRRLCDGTEVSIADGPNNDGTYVWWLVNDGKGDGWAAEGPVSGDVKWLTPR